MPRVTPRYAVRLQDRGSNLGSTSSVPTTGLFGPLQSSPCVDSSISNVDCPNDVVPTSEFTFRARRSTASSTRSVFTAESSHPSPVSDSSTNAVDLPDDEVAVGLAGPGNAGNRREMLQLINRLHDTGYATLLLRLQMLQSAHGMFCVVCKQILTCL